MEFKGVVESKTFVARNFCDIRVRIDKPQEYDFKSGQFALLTFNIHGMQETRAYSFASTPSLLKKEGVVEFGIKKKEGGKVSVYVCEELDVGEEIFLSSARGNMVLDNAPTKHYVFIGVGSGITPLKSIIEFLSETKNYDSMSLIYGNRYAEDVAYHDFFLSLAEEGLDYYPVLSREQKSGFYHGHVQDVLFSSQDLVSSHHTYFLCGIPSMVFDVKDRLLSAGVPEKNVLFEAY